MPATRTAAAAVAVDYADRLVLRTVRDVHRAVSARSFRLTGPAAAPVRLVHDAVSSTVYGVLGAGARATGAALRRTDQGDGADRADRELEAGPRGRRLCSVVNGLVGSSLVESGSPLAIRLAARRDGRDVADVADLASAYPDGSEDVVVFVHGLCEDDESWQLGAAESGGSYADRLAEETDWTPVLLRYNTGLRIERNGELLAEWLQAMVAGWPVPVRRIALVGHSMGGLVALAACRAGLGSGADPGSAPGWTDRLRHVVCLGTPHLGAPLEQAVHRGARLLAAFAESAPFATLLDARSAGILDLGRVNPVNPVGPECEPLPHTTYHCFSGSLPGPVGWALGDLLVSRASATGRIPGATTRHLPGAHHFALLNHPDVYADLRRLLTDR